MIVILIPAMQPAGTAGIPVDLFNTGGETVLYLFDDAEMLHVHVNYVLLLLNDREV